MNEKQLQESIEETTQAIELIVNCKGFGYLEASHAMDILIKERKRFNDELKKLQKSNDPKKRISKF